MDDQQNAVTVDEVPAIGPLILFASAGAEQKPMVPAQELSIVDWQEVPEPQVLSKPQKRKWFLLGMEKYLPQVEPLLTTQVFGCGHTGPRRFQIRIWGSAVEPAKSKHDENCPDCCLALLKEEAIRCCLCSFAILPGEPIAIYNADSVKPKDYDFTIVEGYVVGCLRWDCCPSGGFFAGHWNDKGVDWQGKKKET